MAEGRGDAVVISGLSKTFGGTPVLESVDLAVQEGSLTAVLGPSGSGKTTLLRLLAGFERADAGTITIDGETVEGPGRHVRSEDRGVGYVPQEISLFPHMDVKANVGFGVPRRQRPARVAELLELTGTPGLADRFPHQLSGGQQQRVALARALAPRPSLVLLDEPFSSLDESLRAAVRQDVVAILRRAGATVVMVTHDQDEALSVSDRVALLDGGVVAQVGSPQEVYRRPAGAALARFVGGGNVVTGSLTRTGGAGASSGNGGPYALTDFGPLTLEMGPEGPEGTLLDVLLRPEQLAVDAAGTAGGATGPDGTGMAGAVLDCQYYGHDSIVEVSTGIGVLRARCHGEFFLPPGTRVSLTARGPVVAWPRSVG